MTHRDFEGWDEYNRRLVAATEAGHPEWVRLAATRKEADGASKYFTGIPCKQGHVTPRYAAGVCYGCVNPNAV